MIAKILTSSRTFNGIGYNERKVAEGSAMFLEMKNCGYLHHLDKVRTTDMIRFFEAYSSRNSHTTNTQFHAVISCKEKEYTHTQLLDIAHEYLKGMGYGDPAQPVLVYAHNDTNNNHIHIISSRINPQGQKIDDSFERVKSQKILGHIMGENVVDRLKGSVKNAFAYQFANEQQFMAVLEVLGYETYIEGDKLNIKRGGEVQGVIKIEEIKKRGKGRKIDAQRKKQLKAIFCKFRDLSIDRKELQSSLKKKFGVDLLFLGSKDSPHGYLIVDHQRKSVYKGGDILPIKSLLSFKTREELLADFSKFVDETLEKTPTITSKELSRLILDRYGRKLQAGKVDFNGVEALLPTLVQMAVKINNKAKWLQEFNPSDETQCAALASFGKISPTLIQVSAGSQGEDKTRSAEGLKKLLDDGAGAAALYEKGFVISRQDEKTFIIDFGRKVIYEASLYGIKLPIVQPARELPVAMQGQHPTKRTKPDAGSSLRSEGQASDTSREWEVGGQSYDDIDDERSLRR